MRPIGLMISSLHKLLAGDHQRRRTIDDPDALPA
jgi:hypothetical protein